MRLILISATLFLFWLAMSGHYTPWLIGSGAVLSVAVVAFGLFKGLTDREGFPVELLPRALLYWPWLAWQILRSGWGVAKIVLDPRLPISPTLVRVKARQQTAVGLTTYANSITLTPGTLSVEVSEQGGAIWVHALTAENAAGFEADPMNRHVAWLEGTV